MSPEDKLYAARWVAIGLAIIASALVWTYSGDISDLMLDKTAEFLGNSYDRMGGIATR